MRANGAIQGGRDVSVSGETGSSTIGSRLVGIDLARFVAILGMIYVHVSADATSWAARLAVGNASTLFAVLGGVSVVLATRRYLAAGHLGAAWVAILVRGLLVVLLGLTLAYANGSAVIVLVFFGVAIMLTVPFLAAPSWVIAGAALLLSALGPFATVWSRNDPQNPAGGGQPGWDDLLDPVAAAEQVFLEGTYPVVTWLVYLLIGMLVGRVLLASRNRGSEVRTAITLGISGIAMTLATRVFVNVFYEAIAKTEFLKQLPEDFALALPPGMTVDDYAFAPMQGAPSGQWWSYFLDTPHTGTFFDIARGIGVALVTIAVCLIVARVVPSPVKPLIAPVRAAGAAPLTIYVAHILLLALLTTLAERAIAEGAGTAPGWYYAGPLAFTLHIGLVVLIGGTLAAIRRRGPLETVTSTIANKAAASARSGGRHGESANELGRGSRR